ncbi:MULTISPECIES: YciI family protein [unclassified Nocardioides]|uniref:YciI family protein n=1 Tax=unclassified Nocardioides TaxID=2615069 RepID=UPI00361F997D
MTTYVVLLPGDETVWESATEEQRSAMYARHGEFSRALEERGHKILGGAELTHSREAKVVRRTGDGTTVTDGPYAETVEQLGGYYLVDSDDLDDLLDVCGILADETWPVEVRATVGGDLAEAP